MKPFAHENAQGFVAVQTGTALSGNVQVPPKVLIWRFEGRGTAAQL